MRSSDVRRFGCVDGLEARHRVDRGGLRRGGGRAAIRGERPPRGVTTGDIKGEDKDQQQCPAESMGTSADLARVERRAGGLVT